MVDQSIPELQGNVLDKQLISGAAYMALSG
jgi:hypothetical protein